MPPRSPLAVLALALSGALLASCSPSEPKQVAPPVLVTTETIAARELPNVIELPGRIEAVRTAEVRARTNGIVQRRLYKEGTDVKEGTPLFEIDPREYRAQVQQSEAALQRAVATQTNAAAVVKRYKPLLAERSVSAQEYDAAVSDLRQGEAQVAEARAELAQKQLQLSYTTIRAPITGRVGRAQVTEGALVSGTEATLMTRVDQLAPVYAVFTQSNSAILDIIAQIKAGAINVTNMESVEVRLVLDNGTDYVQVGKLDFADQIVDPQTGSQVGRAVFPNPDNQLSSGQFVRVRIKAGTVANGLAIPTRAVQFQASQASVSVVGPEDSVVARPVQLGAQVDGRWVVLSGIKAGDQVIVDGWQKARAGQKVRVQNDPKAEPSTPAAGK